MDRAGCRIESAALAKTISEGGSEGRLRAIALCHALKLVELWRWERACGRTLSAWCLQAPCRPRLTCTLTGSRWQTFCSPNAFLMRCRPFVAFSAVSIQPSAHVTHRCHQSVVTLSQPSKGRMGPMNQQRRKTSVHCDPIKLRSLREQLAITQEKLAHLSNVERRTVQRAESGQPISLETLADLAAALRVSPDELRLQQDQPKLLSEATGNVVTLRPATTGRGVTEVLERAAIARLDCDVEPTLEIMPTLRAVILAIEAIMPGDPWDSDSTMYRRKAGESLVDKLEMQAALTGHLQALRDAQLTLFIGGSMELVRMPQFGDEGPYTTARQLYESVWAARLLIAPSGPDRLVVSAKVKWPVEVSADGPIDDVPF